MLTRCRESSRMLASGLLVAVVASHAHAIGFSRSYLVDSVAFPTTNTQAIAYGIDLDGDNHVDNQFGAVLSVLSGQGMDWQAPMSNAVSTGGVVHLLGLQSTDAAFVNDPAAQADWYVGNPMPGLLFDGTDSPTIDNSFTPGTYIAALSGGSFTSPAPATTVNPVSLMFNMALILPDNVIALPMQGTRLAFSPNDPGHIQGQINGCILDEDVQTRLIPAMANAWETIVQSDPGSSESMGVKALFDTGCSGQPEFANDGHIEFCEVQESPLIQTLFAPDVLIDSNGHYGPGGTGALSFGFRFTAVARDRVFANGFEAP